MARASPAMRPSSRGTRRDRPERRERRESARQDVIRRVKAVRGATGGPRRGLSFASFPISAATFSMFLYSSAASSPGSRTRPALGFSSSGDAKPLKPTQTSETASLSSRRVRGALRWPLANSREENRVAMPVLRDLNERVRECLATPGGFDALTRSWSQDLRRAAIRAVRFLAQRSARRGRPPPAGSVRIRTNSSG